MAPIHQYNFGCATVKNIWHDFTTDLGLIANAEAEIPAIFYSESFYDNLGVRTPSLHLKQGLI